tara:strand:- start:34 stop:543 length:510 start_codon:yes stop_codon:yes gene_type:complete
MKFKLPLFIAQNHNMKIKIPHILHFLIALLISNLIRAQKDISRFEEFKDWKLGYIIENTLMNLEELDVFKCIFEEYENTYHNEIWSKLNYMRKEYKNSLDTISASLAAQYINKTDNYEMKGIKLKRNRNERLLKKIRPEIVLNILYHEKRFNTKMFSKLRGNTKKQKEK